MAEPTSYREKVMAKDVSALHDEIATNDTIDPEEEKTRHSNNLNEINTVYKSLLGKTDSDSTKKRAILEDVFARGLGVDFPPGAKLTGYMMKGSPATGSQAQVRAVDNATDKDTFSFARGKDSQQPNVQVTALESSDPIERGAIALKGFVEQSRDVIDNLINTVTKSTEEAIAAHNKAADLTLAGGEAKAEAARTEGMVEAASAGTKERILQIANLDTRNADNAFSKALASRLQIRGEREALGKTIDQKMAVGLFDNPLEWLINQTTLPGEVNKYNSMARAENDNVHLIDTLQSEVTRQEQLDLGATADLYLKRSVAMANAEAATASAKASELRASGASLQAARSMNIASLLERRMSQQETLSKWTLALADRRDAAALKEGELQDRKDRDLQISKVGKVIGNNLASFAWLKGQGKDVQEEWAKRAGSQNLGDDFSESFSFIKRFGDLNNMRAQGLGEFADMQRAFQKDVVTRTQQIQDTWAEKHPDQATKVPSRKEAEMLATRDMQIEWEAEKNKDMFRSSPYNPYKANHQSEYLKYKGDKNNPVYLMVQDAYKTGQLIDDKVLIGATQQLVRTGVLTPRDAANSLTEYYNDVVERNNSDRHLTLMGLEKQKGYKIRPPDSAMSLNLSNPVEMENYLTRSAIDLSRQQIVQRAQINPGQNADATVPQRVANTPVDSTSLATRARERAEAAKAGKQSGAQ